MDDATQELNVLKLLVQLHVSKSLDKVRLLNSDLYIDTHTRAAEKSKTNHYG